MNKQILLEKYIKVAVRKALKEQEEQQKRAEKSLYLIYRFPGLKELMEDLMSPVFGRYLSHVDIVAPKPTTFNVKLINNQEFSITYVGKGKFTVKIVGKKYNPLNLGELERASKSITDLLQLNYAPEEGKDQPSSEEGIKSDLEAASPPPTETPPTEEKPEEEETPPPVAEGVKKKVKTLNEIFMAVLNEDVDDDILNALINADDTTKTKVLKFINKSNKNTVSDLVNILKQKDIGNLIKNVIYDINETGQTDELLDYLNSPNQITLDQLLGNENLYSLFKETGLDKESIDALVKISGNIGGVDVGRGEIALITLLKNAKKSKKGDIVIDDKKIEVKNKSTEKGSGSVLAPENYSRGTFSAALIDKLLIEAIDNLFVDDTFKKELSSNIFRKGRWLNRIKAIYGVFLDQKQKNNGNTKGSFEDEINKIFQKLYGENAPKVEDYIDGQSLNTDQFKLDITKKLAEEYYKQSKFDYILFINPDLNYKIYEKDDFLQDIGKNIAIEGFSDYLPRLHFQANQ